MDGLCIMNCGLPTRFIENMNEIKSITFKPNQLNGGMKYCHLRYV